MQGMMLGPRWKVVNNECLSSNYSVHIFWKTMILEKMGMSRKNDIKWFLIFLMKFKKYRIQWVITLKSSKQLGDILILWTWKEVPSDTGRIDREVAHLEFTYL